MEVGGGGVASGGGHRRAASQKAGGGNHLCLLSSIPYGVAPHQVEDLDLALRKKDKDSALTKLTNAQLKLDNVLAKVL